MMTTGRYAVYLSILTVISILAGCKGGAVRDRNTNPPEVQASPHPSVSPVSGLIGPIDLENLRLVLVEGAGTRRVLQEADAGLSGETLILPLQLSRLPEFKDRAFQFSDGQSSDGTPLTSLCVPFQPSFAGVMREIRSVRSRPKSLDPSLDFQGGTVSWREWERGASQFCLTTRDWVEDLHSDWSYGAQLEIEFELLSGETSTRSLKVFPTGDARVDARVEEASHSDDPFVFSEATYRSGARLTVLKITNPSRASIALTVGARALKAFHGQTLMRLYREYAPWLPREWRSYGAEADLQVDLPLLRSRGGGEQLIHPGEVIAVLPGQEIQLEFFVQRSSSRVCSPPEEGGWKGYRMIRFRVVGELGVDVRTAPLQLSEGQSIQGQWRDVVSMARGFELSAGSGRVGEVKEGDLVHETVGFHCRGFYPPEL